MTQKQFLIIIILLSQYIINVINKHVFRKSPEILFTTLVSLWVGQSLDYTWHRSEFTPGRVINVFRALCLRKTELKVQEWVLCGFRRPLWIVEVESVLICMLSVV